jgi:hypothetical protein
MIPAAASRYFTELAEFFRQFGPEMERAIDDQELAFRTLWEDAQAIDQLDGDVRVMAEADSGALRQGGGALPGSDGGQSVAQEDWRQ